MRTAHLIDLIDLVYDLWVNQKGFLLRTGGVGEMTPLDLTAQLQIAV